jgi:hypothetical protein
MPNMSIILSSYTTPTGPANVSSTGNTTTRIMCIISFTIVSIYSFVLANDENYEFCSVRSAECSVLSRGWNVSGEFFNC